MLTKGKPSNPPLPDHSPHTKPQVATLGMRIPGHKCSFLSNSSQNLTVLNLWITHPKPLWITHHNRETKVPKVIPQSSKVILTFSINEVVRSARTFR